jgi:outer membrane lipoprotein-sorting protein
VKSLLLVIALAFGFPASQIWQDHALAASGQSKKNKSSIQMSADDILKRTDEVRCPMTSYYMEVEVHSKGGEDVVKLEVFTKGREKTRVNTLLPVRDKGRNMVMIGEDMWAYVPNLKRAVRVALNQKLTGQASNGDVSRMRWWGDYAATIESEDSRYWVLMLSARKKGLTYEKIRAWVEKGNFRPNKAEYLSLSGLVLKRSRFGEFKKIAGEVRPTEIHIEDAKNSEDSSVLRILNIEARESSDALFNQNALR